MKHDAALLIVDLQKDFCDGGSLAVAGAGDIVDRVNDYGLMFHRLSLPIFASRDWHPAKTRHFRNFGGIWPVHCVQGSEGAAFHEKLSLPADAIVISKGTEPKADDYSCFSARTDSGKPFTSVLSDLGVKTLYIAGLATDYCVKETVLDALRFGFDAVILEDATKGVDVTEGDSARAITAMVSAGARKAVLEDIARELAEDRPGR